MTGPSAARGQIRGPDVFYRGSSCDDLHDVIVTGNWGRANSAFAAEFPDIRIGFPRKQLKATPGAVFLL